MRAAASMLALALLAAGCGRRGERDVSKKRDAGQPDAPPVDGSGPPADAPAASYVAPWRCAEDPDGPEMAPFFCYDGVGDSGYCTEDAPWCCSQIDFDSVTDGGDYVRTFSCQPSPEVPACSYTASGCRGSGNCNAGSRDGGPRYYCCESSEIVDGEIVRHYSVCACECLPDETVFCNTSADCPPTHPVCIQIDEGGACRAVVAPDGGPNDAR